MRNSIGLQDWKTWSINNFVDGFTPLFLTCDANTAANLIEEVLRNKSAATKFYAGLFVTFMNGSETDLIKQIHISRKYTLDGLVLFDYAHLKEDYVDALTTRVFNKSYEPRDMRMVIPDENSKVINQANKKENKKENKKKKTKKR